MATYFSSKSLFFLRGKNLPLQAIEHYPAFNATTWRIVAEKKANKIIVNPTNQLQLLDVFEFTYLFTPCVSLGILHKEVSLLEIPNDLFFEFCFTSPAELFA